VSKTIIEELYIWPKLFDCAQRKMVLKFIYELHVPVFSHVIQLKLLENREQFAALIIMKPVNLFKARSVAVF